MTVQLPCTNHPIRLKASCTPAYRSVIVYRMRVSPEFMFSWCLWDNEKPTHGDLYSENV